MYFLINRFIFFFNLVVEIRVKDRDWLREEKCEGSREGDEEVG